MSQQIVQSSCPNCRTVLRIPVDWVGQSLKCKHCGLVFEVKAKAPPAPVVQVPPPAPWPPQPAPAPWPAAPSPAMMAPTVPATYAPNGTVLMAPPVAAAPPAATAPEAYHGPLVNVPGYGGTNGRRRRSRSSPVATILVSLFLLGLMGGGGYGIYFLYFQNPKDPVATNVVVQKVEHQPTGSSDLEGVKGAFPRRMLTISVNNYLFANPISYGAKLDRTNDRTVDGLMDKLGKYLHVDDSQNIVVSDSAPEGKARPTVKWVMENAIKDFLNSSRAQDRIVVYYAGHALDIDGKGYLVPLDGELKDPETLLPLDWVYGELAKCKARQKVLVMDVCRHDPGRGTERPDAGRMSEKLDELLKTPPPGVQVMTWCTAGQYSWEFENGEIYGGAVLNQIPRLTEKGRPIQKPEEPLPLEQLAQTLGELVNKKVQFYYPEEKMTPRVAGEESAGGVAYSETEKLPERLVAKFPPPPPGGVATRADLQSILAQLDIPPVKIPVEGAPSANLRLENLPPLSKRVMDEYKTDDATTPLPDAIRKTVQVLNKHAKSFPDRFRVPGTGQNAENNFKNQIINDQKPLGLAQYELEEVLEELETAGKEHREKETSKRWQANYDYVHARLLARIAYVREYNLMLGSMRKELPPRDANIHDGWRLASQEKVTDSDAKKTAAAAKKLLDKLAQDHPGTPWAFLAKRESMTALGLRWEAVSFSN